MGCVGAKQIPDNDNHCPFCRKDITCSGFLRNNLMFCNLRCATLYSYKKNMTLKKQTII
jgi:hypothetical protein